MPNASQWRSAENYNHIETLSASDLAWEWLRRNDDYKRDYKALKMPDADVEQLSHTIQKKWGLRFRRRPDATCP